MTRPTKKTNLPPGCRDRGLLLRSLLRDVDRIEIQNGESVATSYPEFVRYFQQAKQLTRHHLIIGASFSYSWMPTILDFRSQRLDEGATILESARAGATLRTDDLLELSKIVNNSVVGASKLLHFVAPERFAIWDSRVAHYLGSRVTGGLDGVERYQGYNDCCLEIATTAGAATIAKKMRRLTACAQEKLRAIELVMFNADVKHYTYAK